MAVQMIRRRFTVADYHRMAEAGILGEDGRVELIEGEIVEMAPIGSRHQACVDRLTRSLTLATTERALVRVRGPIRLGEHSEPQPDLTLLRPRVDFYASAHPGPDDVLLVVEVADTSADYDRGVKLPLYARHGVPEAWLVDLEAGRVELRRSPGAEGYSQVRVFGPGDVLASQALPGVSLTVGEILC